jgi:hypothetical protein
VLPQGQEEHLADRTADHHESVIPFQPNEAHGRSCTGIRGILGGDNLHDGRRRL